MKKIYLLLFLTASVVLLWAQTPQVFKYQAIARDETGNILSNWEIGLRVSIIQGGLDGRTVYSETHKVTSTIYGLISLSIGDGIVEEGDFKSVGWDQNSHFIKLEMDIGGGADYKDMGASQLAAVPYALYAAKAGEIVESERDNGAVTFSDSKLKNSGNAGTNRNGTPNTKFPATGNSYLNALDGKVGIGTTSPDPSAAVEISSSNGGLLPPRMTTDQMFFIVSPAEGLIIYNTTVGALCIYNGSAWQHLNSSCGGLIFDSRDSSTYKTVLIGSQCWMAENLNIGAMITGITDQTNDGIIEKYCYDDIPDSCDTYGGLYQWAEIMQYVTDSAVQGICPPGGDWYIPTDSDWALLANYLGGASIAGGKLKSTGTIQDGDGLWWDPNTGATNESRFSALPGGVRQGFDGSFGFVGSDANFWTSSEEFASNAWLWKLFNDDAQLLRGNIEKNYGFSVRCIKK